jgi:hypothetical protein
MGKYMDNAKLLHDYLKSIQVGKGNKMKDKIIYTKPLEKTEYGGTLSPFYINNTYGTLGNKVYIEKVLYNNPATIVFWSDGTQTRNICPKETLYNPDTGLAFCVLKKFMGGDEMAKLFNDWELKDYRRDKGNWVELKDVRKAHKKENNA